MSNSFIAKPNTQREQQRFFINTQEIYGIQNVTTFYEQGAEPHKFIGMTTPVMVPNGPGRAGCTINTLVIGPDRFLALTGETGFNGYLIKNRAATNQNFSFVSGYLTSYNSRCSIGEIPEISVNIVAFGNAGRLTNEESSTVSGHFSSISGSSPSFVPSIAGPGSMSLTFNNFSTNRVISYDLQINVSRNAYYPLGSRVPNHIQTNYPVEIVLNCQYALNDYAPEQKEDFPTRANVETLSLILRNYKTNAIINSYNFSNLFLLQETQVGGTEGPSIINAVYKGYYGNPVAFTGTTAGQA